MGTAPVVVSLVLGQDRPQVPLAEDQHPVGDLGPGGKHEPFRIGIRARATGRDLHDLDTSVGQDRVKRRGELPGPVTDQEPETCSAITEVHQEVADLLCGPGAVRFRGDPEDVHVARSDLHEEQAVQALEGHRAVDVEEVGGEHRGRLGVQELPPRGVGVPLRCRGDLQGLEDPADSGRADPWPSRPVRVGPLAGDQAAVPAEDGAGSDQPVPPQPCWQEPDQRGEDRPVGPLQPGPRMSAAQHGDFVPQHEQLGIPRGR